MSMMVQHITDIFREILNDRDVNRLLYYKDDPLSPDLPDVQSLDNYYEPAIEEDTGHTLPPIYSNLFKRAPKTDDLNSQPICRVCIYLGSGIPKSPNESYRLLNQDIMIDVYTHIDTFEETEFRNTKISDRICNLLFDKNITGFGSMITYKRLLIPNPPDGHLGYKLIFTFGVSK
ncbi:hypothetical protein [Bacillus pumilus]|uniref:hypothetical protein n=1 Tax=Bacillus pumilus TaxID=1408 RepID=UPI002FFD7DEE